MTNCRQYCFGRLGLITAVLTFNLEVKVINPPQISNICGTSKPCQSAQTSEHAHLLAAMTPPSRVLNLVMKQKLCDTEELYTYIYTIPFVKHWLSRGHWSFFLQLHDLSTLAISGSSVRSTRLLCLSIMLLTLGMQLYDSFNVLRLKIGLRAWPLGKHSSTIRKNCFPRLVLTCAS